MAKHRQTHTCCLCDNRRSTSNIVFHKFPTDKASRKKWYACCEFDYDRDTVDNLLICSDHFTKDCYKDNSKHLKKLSIPTINVPCLEFEIKIENNLNENVSGKTSLIQVNHGNQVWIPEVTYDDKVQTCTNCNSNLKYIEEVKEKLQLALDTCNNLKNNLKFTRKKLSVADQHVKRLQSKVTSLKSLLKVLNKKVTLS